MATVTEAQKKQIMILLAAFISIIIFISGIRPMQENIKKNEALLAQVEEERNAMQAVVDDMTIEMTYLDERENYQIKFQERFENFKSNEKIEAITTEFNMPIRSINIRDFEPVSTQNYERYIAQPKTKEELEEVREDENGSVFPLLLCSQVSLNIEHNGLEDELQMYDAFNNIVPVGPGDSDPDRFCLLVPWMNLGRNMPQPNSNAAANTQSTSEYTIFVFAMETMDLTTWDEEYEARKQGEIS